MTDDIILRPIADLARAGRLAEARAAAEAALGDADRPAVRAMAAMLATRAGDAAGAAAHLAVMHARDPDDRATRFNLAQAWIATGRYEGVAALLAPFPREPRLDRMIAFAAMQLGDMARAVVLYRDVLQAWPDDADSWANLAQAELATGEGEAAIASLEHAITHRRDDVRFYLALAQVLDRLDRPVERRTVARDAAALRPDMAEVQLVLGLAESAMEDAPAAEAALRRALAIDPAYVAAVLELGLLLENRNDLDGLDALIAAARPHAGAELALLEGWSALRRGDLDAAAVAVAALPDTISEHRRAHLAAMVADRRGEPAAAFAQFERMNAAALADGPPEPARRYRDTVAAHAAALHNAPPVAVDDGMAAPAFIIGFPRSGTTLLDTFLGRLPGAMVLEEQPLIPALEHRIGDPARIATLDRAALAALRAEYRAMLAARGAGDAALVIDKHPLHMARMGLVDRLFPGAPILFVERHPYDVVLSCFMANFRLNPAMRSFTDLTEAALTYDAVFSGWTAAEALLPLNVHRVRYERLVADSSAELRAAAVFLDQEFTPALLDNVAAAAARGPVRTASYAQVTEPVYQRSVGRWHAYRAQLEPVIPILRPWAERMGYDG